ncbi:hypothetical protein M430DRAFT_191675 [Amorphotheca resinae ATCC 22711]|uniref:Uncharacterized protein n=1 Tax=Amorphotheca resinae ATCC 22711 TaxID=857342 RepID=A0A2T3APU7_AMORE|nr:hypothetical protein M430DRAFT_191675 [Amorphotheca resinae ATCC 22711]PSS07026.1 hypothetical protein M430DRAFT_191675 [Amorphotheca resinae ATCC 22711]
MCGCENSSIARDLGQHRKTHTTSPESINPRYLQAKAQCTSVRRNRGTSLLLDRVGERPVTSQTCSSNSPGCRPVRGPSELFWDWESGRVWEWEASVLGQGRGHVSGWQGELAGFLFDGRGPSPGRDGTGGGGGGGTVGRLNADRGGEWREKGLGRASDDSHRIE